MKAVGYLLVIIVTLAMPGCSGWHPDVRLATAAALADSIPEATLDSLAAINPSALTEADRHYHDFLTVKASDKAYITHTSDSLILDIIDYAEAHQSHGYYPEALYYGARVYYDLGDYPTALIYFQSALDLLPPDTDLLGLRASVLSQSGRLLNTLRLYDEAIPLIEATLEIDSIQKDTLNLFHDLQLLGGIHLRNSNYGDAEKYFRESWKLAKCLTTADIAKADMYLAATKYQIGQIDSALLLIRDVPEKVRPIVRHSAIAYASTIYLDAGIIDTAIVYANELIHNPDQHHVEIGYQVILSPKLRNLIQIDTLYRHIANYREILESYYDENENQLAIMQESYHNYQTHVRERAKAEKSKRAMQQWIIGMSFIALILATAILYLINRNKSYIIELQKALRSVTQLESALQAIRTPKNKSQEMTSPDGKETVSDLRKQLREKLYKLYKDTTDDGKSITVAPQIARTTAYIKLQNQVSKGVELKANDPLWLELEETVVAYSPDFKHNLQLLVGGKLMSYDLHTSLLIKCGISFSQMTILLNRSKGAIVSRRESLCFRIFDEKLGTRVIDGIIRLL